MTAVTGTSVSGRATGDGLAEVATVAGTAAARTARVFTPIWATARGVSPTLCNPSPPGTAMSWAGVGSSVASSPVPAQPDSSAASITPATANGATIRLISYLPGAIG